MTAHNEVRGENFPMRCDTLSDPAVVSFVVCEFKLVGARIHKQKDRKCRQYAPRKDIFGIRSIETGASSGRFCFRYFEVLHIKTVE